MNSANKLGYCQITLRPHSLLHFNWRPYNSQIQACVFSFSTISWPTLGDLHVRVHLCSTLSGEFTQFTQPTQTSMHCDWELGSHYHRVHSVICSITVIQCLQCLIFIYYPYWNCDITSFSWTGCGAVLLKQKALVTAPLCRSIKVMFLITDMKHNVFNVLCSLYIIFSTRDM